MERDESERAAQSASCFVQLHFPSTYYTNSIQVQKVLCILCVYISLYLLDFSTLLALILLFFWCLCHHLASSLLFPFSSYPIPPTTSLSNVADYSPIRTTDRIRVFLLRATGNTKVFFSLMTSRTIGPFPRLCTQTLLILEKYFIIYPGLIAKTKLVRIIMCGSVFLWIYEFMSNLC